MALGWKMDKRNSRVYCLLGDGETQEGQVWEAAMTASHYNLDNLCAIIDNNGLQIDGQCCDVMCIEPIVNKWEAFGWNVIDINGHDMKAVIGGLDMAESVKMKPTMIVARTVKGKGVSFFENKVEYHGITPTHEELEMALKELKR
jgi:transketolase